MSGGGIAHGQDFKLDHHEKEAAPEASTTASAIQNALSGASLYFSTGAVTYANSMYDVVTVKGGKVWVKALRKTHESRRNRRSA